LEEGTEAFFASLDAIGFFASLDAARVSQAIVGVDYLVLGGPE
jgi:hypothetical protein